MVLGNAVPNSLIFTSAQKIAMKVYVLDIQLFDSGGMPSQTFHV